MLGQRRILSKHIMGVDIYLIVHVGVRFVGTLKT